MSTELANYEAPAPARATQPTTDMVTSRAVQEVQAAMVVAQRFPRDQNHAIEAIKTSCQRTGLAEKALYSYPRGGQTVTGASIRLAELLAQAWGNIDFGVVELEQRKGESTCMAYAHDLQTNTRQQRTFTVKHERSKKDPTTGKSGGVPVTDPRDIYEMVANYGARRLRECLLSVIPIDVREIAVETCRRTLAGRSEKPIEDRVREALSAFKSVGVSQAMIEAKLGHPVGDIIEAELSQLVPIYNTLKDGAARREDYFSVAQSAKPASRAEQVKQARQPAPQGAPTPMAEVSYDPGHAPADPATAAVVPEDHRDTVTQPAADVPSDVDPSDSAAQLQAFLDALPRQNTLQGVSRAYNRFTGPDRLTDDDQRQADLARDLRVVVLQDDPAASQPEAGADADADDPAQEMAF